MYLRNDWGKCSTQWLQEMCHNLGNLLIFSKIKILCHFGGNFHSWGKSRKAEISSKMEIEGIEEISSKPAFTIEKAVEKWFWGKSYNIITFSSNFFLKTVKIFNLDFIWQIFLSHGNSVKKYQISSKFELHKELISLL